MIVTLVVLPADRPFGEAETSNVAALAGVTVTPELMPVIEPVAWSEAVMNCVPAVSSVTVNVPTPLVRLVSADTEPCASLVVMWTMPE